MNAQVARPDDIVSSSISRAKRLKRLRKMTGLSRKAFSIKYNISQGTLQNWETARFGGLTEKGAKIILKSLREEGIHCNFEWLMYGAGQSPSILGKLYTEFNPLSEPKTKMKKSMIPDELAMFFQLHPDAISICIEDDAMEPYFSIGEYVLGKKRQGSAIQDLLDQNCIIELTNNEKYLRFLREGSDKDRYDLISLNPYATSKVPMMHNMELLCAAPVMWIRREALLD